MAIQVKTEKVNTFLQELKSSLRENSDLVLYINTNNDKVSIWYNVCVRRDNLYNVVKRYINDINKFIELWNKSSFSKGQKVKKINLKDYEFDTEYSEYEINFGKSVSIQLGKNQTKYIKV